MEATLIFNQNAGGSNRVTPERLIQALEGIGYHPVYEATSSEADLEKALERAQGTVFVAGGDGTIRATALHLIGRDLHLGILPMGTANNIGRTLGIVGEPLDVIDQYSKSISLPFDVGHVRAPWGEDYFLEACGCGLYADMLAAYNPENGKSPMRALQVMSTTLAGYQPLPVVACLDHQDISGSYLMAEVLNTQATGPRMRLAPEAHPGDGLFDVVTVNPEQRDSMFSYLGALIGGSFTDLASVSHQQGRLVEFHWMGQPFHVDGEVRPQGATGPLEGAEGQVVIELLQGALHMLVPAREEHHV
ncbi:diacylglycerol/lipid kinase family protein [Deinococcus cellulosilyticus]|uniref:Diacylglycerol kinase n=1 Tax=Deinococcus cellulosilyticus (strain DSM 18568 / NBRC 106333 / KACC 11606 / 5516J-15) TaxID=1223518 RepID=A0A511MV70_DEIC1|nr:diacylglycerol kinase family protein [Deinococcus cellulosilyticus]GEM44475.1 diacylglycerol kinase [Deinococcus cellulosilyticus NBRC 106333 = KACC 11606]